jgi:hypothetical protein
MPHSNKPKKNNRTTIGYCNICNQRAKLTWDHVPPKGSIDLTPVEITALLDTLGRCDGNPVEFHHQDESVKQRIPRKGRSQNGLKYRSICAECNNDRLGARYDLELNRVSAEVSKLVRGRFEAGLALPTEFAIKVKTHLLLRGLIGHVLAARRSLDQTKPLGGFDSGFNHALRAYVLDENLPIPPSVRVYYWVYPSRDHVIIPALGVADRNGGPFFIGDLIKFFPLAYYIVDSDTSTMQLPTATFMGDGCNDMDCTVDLFVDLAGTPPINWPETPTKEYCTVMTVEMSVVASARKPP